MGSGDPEVPELPSDILASELSQFSTFGAPFFDHRGCPFPLSMSDLSLIILSVLRSAQHVLQNRPHLFIFLHAWGFPNWILFLILYSLWISLGCTGSWT
ncbi:hypothetical protein AVEN_129258-1 [Araneus ventricosus]|uniref:Uncharacterized protein n=1 Tax=Araneus ventricosus TaxID=182803 RepID=A0A4Y2HMK6_ARAVE|nr:hypothetical protein AVEN_129258-1 [Araneus ventricosus]